MAVTRTVSQWGRITITVVLAAAVAVSPAVAVAAETPTAVPATAAEPTPADVSPAAPVEELNALADALTGLAATREGGAGTAAAGFTSAGQTYAALAHNPTNGKLYAVSPAADGQGADRLLRINPLSGEVLDLGPLTAASGSEEPKGLTNGTFTNDGTFVLFPDEVTADARVFTLDLAKDDSQAATERAMTPHEIRVSPEAEELGVEKLAAFASMPGKADPEGKDLYSFAISGGTKPVLYRYNLEDETLYAAHASVAPGVDQAAVTRETPVAAWVKSDDTFVAADAEGATVEVTPTRGSLNAPAISATSRVAPSELAGEMAQSTVEGVAPAAAAVRAGDVENAENAEPEAGASDVAAPGASDAGEDGKDESGVEKPAATADLTVRVKDSSGKPLAGATVETVSGRKAVTDSTGRAVLAGLSQAGYSVTVSKDGYKETVFDIDLAKRAEKEVRLERDESDSVPKQIEGVLKELTPLLAALGVPVAAASGASGGSKSTTRTTTTRATTSKSTSTSTTTAAPASQKAAAATAPRTVSAKASTRNAAAPAAGRAAGKTTSAGAKSAKAASSTTTKTRDGKLADTGTPMTAVISLGVLFILLGAAYVAMGRRRENY